jgi:hypothetical protein
MNNDQVLIEALSAGLTDEQYHEEFEREDNEEGLYATDLSGIVDVFGRDGLYKIVRYCREHGLRPRFKSLPGMNDGGTLTFSPESAYDELTEKMHSEFTISPRTERKHRVWAALTLSGTEDWEEIKKWAEFYEVTLEDVDEFIGEFKALKGL